MKIFPSKTTIPILRSREKSPYDIWIVTLCAIVGSLVLFSLVNNADVFDDEYYQSICVIHYKESPLGLLTYWVGHLWSSAFGFSVLNLRILTSLLLWLSMVITSIYCYSLSRNIRLSSVTFLLGAILLRAGTFYIYNWDTGTYVYEAMALCFIVSFFYGPNLIKLVPLGFAIGLMTLGRLTSGIMLPASMILVFIYSRSQVKTILVREVILVFSWLFAMLLFTWIILGSPAEYIKAFYQGKIISGHTDIHVLWGKLAGFTLNIHLIWGLGTVCMLISILLAKLKDRTSAIVILAVWLTYCVFCQLYLSKDSHKIDLTHGLGTPIGIGLLLVIPIFRLFKREVKVSKSIKYSLWACALLLFSIAFGSDTYLRRVTVGFTIPVIIGILWQTRDRDIRNYLTILVTVCIMTFGSMYMCNYLSLVSTKNKISQVDIRPLTGLYDKFQLRDEIEGSYNAISKVRSQHIPYLYMGNHLASELVFGPDEGLPFHDYHYEFRQPEVWFENKHKFIKNVDAIIYPVNIFDRSIPGITEDIIKEGFTDSIKIDNAVVFYRNPRMNPDKLYR